MIQQRNFKKITTMIKSKEKQIEELKVERHD